MTVVFGILIPLIVIGIIVWFILSLIAFRKDRKSGNRSQGVLINFILSLIFFCITMMFLVLALLLFLFAIAIVANM